jgi:hypothetical protein
MIRSPPFKQCSNTTIQLLRRQSNISSEAKIVNAPIFRSRKETQTDENQYIANQRFDPQTAVVETIIIGRSDLLGVIKYYGGCYAQAITYEPIILPVGTRVRVLGRIPGQNIWVVSPLPQLLAIPSTKPSTNWAEKYRKSQTVNRRKTS